MEISSHRRSFRLLAAGLALAVLAACSSGGGGGGLSAGLTQRMDAPGASLNRAEALGIVNAYRASTGTPALSADSSLDATAQSLAAQYAATGQAPSLPPGARAMRLSAGYATFAETFSGWRNSPPDAAVLTDRSANRAGVATAYNANSAYGVYWVLVLGN